MAYRLVMQDSVLNFDDPESALVAVEEADREGAVGVLWGVRQDGTLAEPIVRTGQL